ncbi:MAG: SDR family NAD(P)-dependent oxidoreductase [Chthonomonadales bacterium]
MEPAWKHAIVIGASSGIGAELARMLGRSGCRVALVSRRADLLDRLAQEINAHAPSPVAAAYPHDVTRYEEVPALFQQICRDLGGLDLVIYAAGVMPTIGEDEFNFAKDRAIVEVNLLGAIAWLNEAAVRFLRAGEGVIVGISSVAGDRGRRGNPVYCASKAALATYLEALRNRLSRHGVAVVTIKPGPVDTPMTAGQKLPLMIPPERAAAAILAAAARRRHTAYVPGIWRPIMFIIRNIPSFLFRKLNL